MSKAGGIRSAFDDDDSESEELFASFAPQPVTERPSADKKNKAKKAVERVAETSGFRKREKIKKGTMRRSQFYQTGRNTQIAMKGRSEDKERIAALCNKHEWVQGQLMQYALDALEEKLGDPSSPFWSDRSFEGVD